jgi:hypothetical protein
MSSSGAVSLAVPCTILGGHREWTGVEDELGAHADLRQATVPHIRWLSGPRAASYCSAERAVAAFVALSKLRSAFFFGNEELLSHNRGGFDMLEAIGYSRQSASTE